MSTTIDHTRVIEFWAWYGVASLIVILRYASRAIRLGGWCRWEIDDYIMLLAFAFYTNFVIFVNFQKQHQETNILPSAGTAGMSQYELNDRILGSKITFVTEQSMVMLLFLCKICMCLVYYKLTDGMKGKRLWINIVTSYVVIGWLVTEIFFFAIWCRPFQNYFLVFDANSVQCTAAKNHLIMSFTFNISSDLLILAAPIPLLIQLQLPWKRKAAITGVFSLGIFVVVSATASRIYTFTQPDSILWVCWYVREASTAILVANIPHLYPLLRQLFSFEDCWGLVKRTKTRIKYGPRTVNRTNPERIIGNADSRPCKFDRDLSLTGSTEKLTPKDTMPLQIWQQKDYSVTTYERTDLRDIAGAKSNHLRS